MNNENNENKQNIEQEQNNNKKIVGLKPNLQASKTHPTGYRLQAEINVKNSKHLE